MLIFLVLVNRFEHLTVFDLRQKAVKQQQIYMFSDFFNTNQYIFTLIFALRVTSSTIHHMMTKLRNFAKICNFCKIRSTILNT